ncbi:MAG: hypothetical protein AAB363_08605 [Planctomycetota bacterium]
MLRSLRPRRSRGDDDFLDAHVGYARWERIAVDPISPMDAGTRTRLSKFVRLVLRQQSSRRERYAPVPLH